MISTLLIVSSLSLGFPEVPVGPVRQPLASQQEEEVEDPDPEVEEIEVEPADVQEVEPELFDEDQALRDQAARDQALREQQQAMEPAVDDDDWARDEAKRKPAYPKFQLRALATATLPVTTQRNQGNDEFLIGVRGELDILRASMLFSWDRGGFTPISLSETLTDTNYWNGLIGPSLWVTRHSRIRLLGGLSAVSDPRAVQFGPTLGMTVRLGIPVISIEGAALYTPVGFMQLDARAELVLRLLIFELRGGYRGRLLDTERSRVGEQVPVESTGGLTVSLGLVF